VAYIHAMRPGDPGRGKQEALCGEPAPKNGEARVVTNDKARVDCWHCVLLLCSRPVPAEPDVPEHKKLEKAKKTDDATQIVGEFIDWLREEKGVVFAKWGDSELYAERVPVQRMLGEFFGISESALESEKQALLKYQRELNKAIDWANKEGRGYLRRSATDK
jgi:hypothetical protein